MASTDFCSKIVTGKPHLKCGEFPIFKKGIKVKIKGTNQIVEI